ncbi:MAG TPA: TlpA disulfide reductase family protein [Anaerolineaceae bacterium]|nr:TlpA disulfide reductase family protein [Anaerolineaceae bacterium]
MHSNFLITDWIRQPGRLPLVIALGILVLLAAFAAVNFGSNLPGSNGVPNLTLESLDGERVSLNQYRGSVVLINFWATWCPPCQKEIPALDAAYQAYADQGFVILGLDVGESRQAVERYATGIGISYPILLDEDDQWMSRFGGVGLPMSVLIDRDGQIAETHLGELTPEELDGLLAAYFTNP